MDFISLNEENLHEVWGLYNRNLIYDNLSLDAFREKTLNDPDFDPELTPVAMSDDKPVGFMMAVVRDTDDGPSAGIKVFAVDEQYRNQGIASDMLEMIETEAKARGAQSLTVGMTRPDYITPGIDPKYTVACAFMLRRGYNKGGQPFNMDVDLSASDWSTEALEKKLADRDIICRRLRPEEKERLDSWMESNGNSKGWRYQVMKAAEQDPVGVFIAEQSGAIIAFACYDGVRPSWFGPMATAEGLKGGGVGTVAYLKCLQSMKEVGYDICHINSVGPLYFYSKVSNAVVSRIFWQFEKQLK